MAFVPVSNTARFELIFTHNGVKCENVFHVQNATSSWTSGELHDKAANFANWWITYMAPVVHTTTSLDKIIATSLHTQVSPVYEYTTALPQAGAGTSAPLPGNVTVAVKWTTGNRGRSARGRTYHVGLMESQVTGNLIDEGFYTTLLTGYQGLLDYITESVNSMRVVSLWSNKVKRESGVTYPILACSIDTTIDTQRRRLV